MPFRLGKDRIGTVGAAYGPNRIEGKHVSRIEVVYRREHFVTNFRTC